MSVMHRHHKIPKHRGGTDDPSNIIEVSVEQHAELHLYEYLCYGLLGDWLAYHGLSGQMNGWEINLEASRQGGYTTAQKLTTEERKRRARKANNTPEKRAARGTKQIGVQKHGGFRTEEDKRKISEGTKKAMAKLDVVGRPPKSVKFGDKTYTTMKECASDLGIHLITAYRWRSEGKIK